jgi:hypothetical protein
MTTPATRITPGVTAVARPKAFSLKTAKQRFMERLHALGIPESELIVAPMRKTRDGSPVGYYSHMSQFRSKARVVVDVAYIEDRFISKATIEEEMLLTIAHEYGHIIAEALAHVNRHATAVEERFAVPDWKSAFNDDEEVFAEDFARFCITYDALHEDFWDKFVPLYGLEFRRVFQVTEKPA